MNYTKKIRDIERVPRGSFAQFARILPPTSLIPQGLSVKNYVHVFHASVQSMADRLTTAWKRTVSADHWSGNLSRAMRNLARRVPRVTRKSS